MVGADIEPVPEADHPLAHMGALANHQVFPTSVRPGAHQIRKALAVVLHGVRLAHHPVAGKGFHPAAQQVHQRGQQVHIVVEPLGYGPRAQPGHLMIRGIWVTTSSAWPCSQ